MRFRSSLWRRVLVIGIAALILAAFGITASAQDDVQMATQASVDTAWVLATGFLVFFMQCGFAMLETGLIRQTGAVNALLENFIDAGVTAVAFWAVGFGIAFGTSVGGLFGASNFFLSDAIIVADGSVSFAKFAAYPNLDVLTLFFFQFAFAATASTITTGAMAERTDFVGDLIYSAVMGAISYPIIVHWVWGGGWLAQLGFHDFAGSTVVHTVGGITAIVGAWMLGPRKFRVGRNGEWKPQPPAHNLGLATIGTMILWFGWYGFNPGSTLGTGNTGLTGLITLNTTLGAAGGTLVCMLLQYARSKKWNLVYTLNGSLAGLVAVTAGCAFISPAAALFIGAVAGALVIYAADAIERLRIDDPVGAFAVHGACGIWGTLAVGLFGMPGLTYGVEAAIHGGLFYGGGVSLLGIQAVGSLATILFTGVFALVMFGALKAFGHLRANTKADTIGIDLYEHGTAVWPDLLPVPADEAPAAASASPAIAPAVGD
ncbi:MAG: ammonium transporter [Chloroflexi bacterium]|nr:ammonium transporter [Chloroflexota bacterium]MBV6437886.1 Ammonium transporter [Anaerolineae bacterium]